MFAAMAIAAFLVTANILVHYEVLRLMSLCPESAIAVRLKVLTVVLGCFVAHTIEVWLYAGAFLLFYKAGIGSLKGEVEEHFADLSPAVVQGSKELNTYHETFPPRNFATPTFVRARELKLEHRPQKCWVVDLDFCTAFGNVQHRTYPGRERPVDCHPRFLISPSAGGMRFSPE
jgi:hypothetical protein